MPLRHFDVEFEYNPLLMHPSDTGTPVKQRLMALRMVYGMLLLGQAGFVLVLLIFLLPQHKGPRLPEAEFFWVNIGLIVVVVPAAYLVRRAIFEASRQAGGIPVERYSTGNLLFWAGCEGVTFASLIFVYLTGVLMPGVLIAAVAVGLQLATRPRAADVIEG
jgi:hypothetical protein